MRRGGLTAPCTPTQRLETQMRSNPKSIVAISILAFSLSTLFAAGAQGQLPGESKTGVFLINLSAASLATFAGKQIGAGLLLVEGRGIEIICESAHLNGKINSATDATVEATFLQCKSYEHGGPHIFACVIKGGTHNGGGTIVASALILPVLHGGNNYVLLEPESGTNITNISYIANLGCVLPLNNPVTGSVTAQVIEGVTGALIFDEGIQLLTGDKLLFGAFPAYIGANTTIELTGPDPGKKIGVH
jgi:hypothetical protein